MPLLENLLSQGTVERLGWMLVHCLWQATAVALLLAAALRLLRRTDASLRYVASCAALALMVAAPVVTIRFIRSTEPLAESGSVPAIQPATIPSSPWTDQVVSEGSALAEPLTMSDTAAPAPTPSWHERIVSTLKPALPYAVFGWLLGVFGLSAWHIGGWAQLQRIKRRMVQQVGPALQNKAEDLGARLGVRRGVALLESALVEVPTVIGWIRPAILLPASALTGLSPDQLEAILAHELAHIRRYDYLVNVLQTVVEILGFYHPAVWWVSRRIRIERENCCDDLAVRVCGNSLRYARALTYMEEIRHRRTEWAVAATGGSLFARIARVLGRPAADDRRFAWLPGLLSLVLITALLIPTAFVLGAAGPQQTNDSSDGMVVEDVNTASDLPEAQPGDHVKVQVQTDANDTNTASAEEKASVLLEFTIAKVLNGAALDRETTLLALNILGETAWAGAPDVTPPMTAHEVFRKYVAGRELPPETSHALTDLLRSRGYIQIKAHPQVMTRDGTEANIRVVAEVPIPVPAMNGDTSQTTIEYVECGTAIRATPHVDGPDVVTLEMAVELTGVLPNPQPQWTPRVRRRGLESTLTLSTERYFSLLMEPQLDEANETPDEAPVLVMVKPSIPEPLAAHVTQEDGTPKHSASVRRRQVLLDARVVTVERGNLLNLGVEWAWPKLRAGFNYDSTGNGNIDSNQMTGIRLGYTSGHEFTDSLLAALDLLQESGQAEILSSPQILAQDGRQAQLKVVTEEYFMMTPPTPGESPPSVRQLQKIEIGTTLTVTPHVGDHNDLTLEMAVEVSDSVPNRRGRGLPLVTRRIARNAVTIENGGTVALAGLMESRSRSKDSRAPGLRNLPPVGPLFQNADKDRPLREVAIFVTAHLVDNREGDDLPQSESSQATVHLPLPGTRAEQGKEEPGSPPRSTRGELLWILASLSQRTGTRIMVDMAVKPTSVVLDFDPTSVPVADALPRILRDTDYRFRQTGENTYLVYRPITCLFAGRDLREALLQLSATTEVPIIPDANVAGKVYADIRDLPLGKALEILLAGTPYVVKRMPDYYLVTDRSSPGHAFPGVCETRMIHLSHITPQRIRSLLSPAFAPYVKTEPADPRDLNSRGSIVTITAPASLADRIEADVRRFDVRPRQVLLDVRMATMRYPDLLDLGIEWGTEPLVTNGPSDKEGIRVGYVRDRASTDSLLAGLNRLTESKGAELIAAPQLVAQDGQPSYVPPMGGEVHSYWIGESRMERRTKRIELQRTDEATSFSITPHVGDHNDITLEISAAISDSRPNSQRGGPPIVVRRALKNTTTVNDGGTVVWAGRAKSGSEAKRAPGLDKLPLIGPLFRNNDKDKTPREVVIFVTARLADRLPTDNLPASQPVATTIRVPPLPAREEQGKREPRTMATATTGNLTEILTNLSQRTGAKIVTDATVKPIPVALDFDPIDMPVAKALQRILQGTDYRFRIVGDNAYLVYRPITCLYAGRDLREALQDLSVAASVPIILDPNVTGPVYADIREQPVEKALEILLAGTGYVVKQTPEYYLVADRSALSPGFPEVTETRVIPLSHTPPERVKSLIARAFAPYVKVEPADPRDPNNRGSIVTVTAPGSLADRIAADVRRFDARPRQVLLDARVMAMSHRDLLNLGIDWAKPVLLADAPSDSAPGSGEKIGDDAIKNIRVGYVQHRAATDSLHAKLYELSGYGQAELIVSPQILAQDGRRCQLKLASEAWYNVPDSLKSRYLMQRAELQKIDANTALYITPRVSDHDDITLEMSLEVRDRTPQDQSSDLPAVMRRVAENVVTIADGGTVVWAGLGRSGIEQEKKRAPTFGEPLLGPLFRKGDKDKSPREVVIFVTAYLVRDVPTANAADGARETRRIVPGLEPRTE